MSSNKLIVKNTLMLYIRMLCSVCINLYSSRILLERLGIDDFGIYNIVGGIVAMLAFLNTTMSGCTSRFLTYELGKGDTAKLKTIFSSALQIHILIAIAVLLIGESIGLWFVNTQLTIPESKMTAINFVYQFSLISALFSFIQVPYMSDVIAHERMGVYAFIELLHVSLKLCAAFLIAYLSIERLISYSATLSIVSLIIFLLYRIYSKRFFEETEFNFVLNKGVLISMFKFIGWDFYGNACVIVQQQGTNILINRFFGVALNAATGIATQASSAVSMFVSSFTMALRPPIIKKYASGEFCELQKMLGLSIVVCMFLVEIVCLPLYLRIDKIMSLWLIDVPPFAVSFCKWMLLANSVNVMNTLFTALIHATGNIKRLSFISGTIYLLTVVFSYFAFRNSFAPTTAYVILFLLTIIVLINNALIVKRQIPKLSFRRLITDATIPCVSLFIAIISVLYINKLLNDTIGGILLLFVLNAIVACSSLYLLWAMPKYGWNLKRLIKQNDF